MYRILNRNTFYNKNFNLSLPAIALITAAIILTIQSNIVISLGMVGALSIVRFRTAIKDPMDLVYLFWAISIGIICGAGFAIIAVIVSVALTIFLLVADRLPIARAPQVLVINSNRINSEEEIQKIIKRFCTANKVKARNISANHLDMAIEIRTKEESKLVENLMKVEGVSSISLVAHDGEVTY